MSCRRNLGLPRWAMGLVALLLALPLSGALLPTGVAFADDPEPEVSDADPEATADPDVAETRDVWDRFLSVEAHLGIDTPYGIFGAGIEVAPIRYVALFVAGGIAREGGRFTGGVRLRYPIGIGTLGLQLGAGGGPMTWEGEQGAEQTWDMAPFLHAAVYVELRTEMGVYVRLFAGAETTLTAADACTGPGGGTCDPEAMRSANRPFLGLSGGYAFDL